jgi:hypothetical protein
MITTTSTITIKIITTVIRIVVPFSWHKTKSRCPVRYTYLCRTNVHTFVGKQEITHGSEMPQFLFNLFSKES